MRVAALASLARSAQRGAALRQTRAMAAGNPSFTGTVYKEARPAAESALACVAADADFV